MTEKLDVIVVIDIEATCWKGAPPPGQENEIIEIGICLVDVDNRKRIDESNQGIFVKPVKSMVGDYCTQLTTITQEQVDTGISLKEACSILQKDYLTKERTWASWGNYDKKHFEIECELKNIEYPFSLTHINVKNRFAIDRNLPQEIELMKAMQMVNTSFVGTQHRAVDDAFNIAYILANLLSE